MKGNLRDDVSTTSLGMRRRAELREAGCSFLDYPVPVFVQCDALFGRVSHRLSRDGFRCLRVREAAEIVRAPKAFGVWLVQPPAHTTTLVHRAAYEVAGAPFFARAILLSPGLGSSRRASRFLSDSLYEVREPFRLRTTVLQARVSSWKDRIRTEIRARQHVPFILREALVTIVLQEVAPSFPLTGQSGSLNSQPLFCLSRSGETSWTSSRMIDP